MIKQNYSIIILLLLILLTSCFKNNKYNINFYTEKNIKNLYSSEEFYIEIEEIGSNTFDFFQIKIDNDLYNGLPQQEILVKSPNNLGKYNLEIIINNKTIKTYQIKINKLKVKNLIYCYIVADNNLNLQAISDIEELKNGSFSKYSTGILVFLDRQSDTFDNRIIYIYDGKERVLSYLNEKNSGDISTLNEFIEYGKNNIESETNTLVVWSHGDGWLPDESLKKRAIAYDDTSQDSLNLFELEEGIKSFGKQWDLLIFDACLMNGMETIYQLKDTTKYIIGSSEDTPIAGFNYKELVYNFDLTENGYKEIIDNVVSDHEVKEVFSTYSLIKTEKIEELNNEINLFSENLLNNLEKIQENKKILVNELLTYTQIENDYTKNTFYADLESFLDYLINNNILVNESNQLKEKIKEVIIYKKATNNFPELKLNKSSGLNIYLPLNKYDPMYEKSSTFGIENTWKNFIKELVKPYP